MSLRIGIIGLPNAGKSTLLNALARTSAVVAPYPFTTIEPNRGVVPVPDGRLAALAGAIHPERVIPATVEFVDIAGLVRGASRGEGLGNQFLAHIREVDALAHVVRFFGASDVAHVEGAPDGRRDVEIVETELALADLAVVERVRERAAPRARTGDKDARAELALAERLVDSLGRGLPARRIQVSTQEAERMRGWHLLTSKPVLYVANVDEAALADEAEVAALRRHAEEQGAAIVVLSARLEAELAQLPLEESDALRPIEAEPGLPRLARAAYALLHLVTFFTILSSEVRAWPVPGGTGAVDAAGRIHTDMARGFVRAEVIPWDVLVTAEGMQQARERGLVRLEGRSYQVQDGDVITFRFAV